MGSLNRATLCGNIGSEPKITPLQNGNKCAQFTLATSEPAYTLSNGTQVPEKTEWHNIVVWGSNASIVERFLQKGAQVYLEGKLHTRKYAGKDGIERYVTEIVADNIVLLRGNMKEQAAAEQPATATAQANAPAQVDAAEKKDDLPF